MTYRERTYESTSTANLFSTADYMVRTGWQAWKFSTRIDYTWLFRRTVYAITFRLRLPPSQPGAVTIRVTAEDENMLQFFVALPQKTEGEFDVVSRKLEIEIGGTVLESQVVSADIPEAGPFGGVDGAVVKIRCWNVDDAGNISQTASEFEGTLLDTFAPPAPGQLGIRVSGETPDVPAPVDPVEPVDPVDPADPVDLE